jgi:hypothetical protein
VMAPVLDRREGEGQPEFGEIVALRSSDPAQRLWSG